MVNKSTAWGANVLTAAGDAADEVGSVELEPSGPGAGSWRRNILVVAGVGVPLAIMAAADPAAAGPKDGPPARVDPAAIGGSTGTPGSPSPDSSEVGDPSPERPDATDAVSGAAGADSVAQGEGFSVGPQSEPIGVEVTGESAKASVAGRVAVVDNERVGPEGQLDETFRLGRVAVNRTAERDDRGVKLRDQLGGLPGPVEHETKVTDGDEIVSNLEGAGWGQEVGANRDELRVHRRSTRDPDFEDRHHTAELTATPAAVRWSVSDVVPHLGGAPKESVPISLFGDSSGRRETERTIEADLDAGTITVLMLKHETDGNNRLAKVHEHRVSTDGIDQTETINRTQEDWYVADQTRFWQDPLRSLPGLFRSDSTGSGSGSWSGQTEVAGKTVKLKLGDNSIVPWRGPPVWHVTPGAKGADGIITVDVVEKRDDVKVRSWVATVGARNSGEPAAEAAQVKHVATDGRVLGQAQIEDDRVGVHVNEPIFSGSGAGEGGPEVDVELALTATRFTDTDGLRGLRNPTLTTQQSFPSADGGKLVATELASSETGAGEGASNLQNIDRTITHHTGDQADTHNPADTDNPTNLADETERDPQRSTHITADGVHAEIVSKGSHVVAGKRVRADRVDVEVSSEAMSMRHQSPDPDRAWSQVQIDAAGRVTRKAGDAPANIETATSNVGQRQPLGAVTDLEVANGLITARAGGPRDLHVTAEPHRFGTAIRHDERIPVPGGNILRAVTAENGSLEVYDTTMISGDKVNDVAIVTRDGRIRWNLEDGETVEYAGAEPGALTHQVDHDSRGFLVDERSTTEWSAGVSGARWSSNDKGAYPLNSEHTPGEAYQADGETGTITLLRDSRMGIGSKIEDAVTPSLEFGYTSRVVFDGANVTVDNSRSFSLGVPVADDFFGSLAQNSADVLEAIGLVSPPEQTVNVEHGSHTVLRILEKKRFWPPRPEISEVTTFFKTGGDDEVRTEIVLFADDTETDKWTITASPARPGEPGTGIAEIVHEDMQLEMVVGRASVLPKGVEVHVRKPETDKSLPSSVTMSALWSPQGESGVWLLTKPELATTRAYLVGDGDDQTNSGRVTVSQTIAAAADRAGLDESSIDRRVVYPSGSNAEGMTSHRSIALLRGNGTDGDRVELTNEVSQVGDDGEPTFIDGFATTGGGAGGELSFVHSPPEETGKPAVRTTVDGRGQVTHHPGVP